MVGSNVSTYVTSALAGTVSPVRKNAAFTTMRRKSSLVKSTDAPIVVQNALPLVVPFGAVYSRSHATGIIGLFFGPSTGFEEESNVAVTAPRIKIVASFSRFETV